MICPSLSSLVEADAITTPFSLSADRYSISSEIYFLPFSSTLATKYGVSMKPKSFTRAYVARDVIRPQDGPSGVSIGHILP